MTEGGPLLLDFNFGNKTVHAYSAETYNDTTPCVGTVSDKVFGYADNAPGIEHRREPLEIVKTNVTMKLYQGLSGEICLEQFLSGRQNLVPEYNRIFKMSVQ